MKVIAITGKIGSGKNTVAEMLKERLKGSNIIECAFAYRLKEVVSTLYDIPFKDTLTQDGKNKLIDDFDITIGEALQRVGTALCKEISDDIWVKLLDKRIKNANADYVLITDLRLPAEYEYVKKMNGTTIRVIRENNDINDNSKRNKKHISEIGLDNIEMDFIIENNKDLKHLEKQVNRLYL